MIQRAPWGPDDRWKCALASPWNGALHKPVNLVRFRRLQTLPGSAVTVMTVQSSKGVAFWTFCPLSDMRSVTGVLCSGCVAKKGTRAVIGHRSTPKPLSQHVRCESDSVCGRTSVHCTHLNVVAELNIQTRAADHGVSTSSPIRVGVARLLHYCTVQQPESL